MDLRSDGNVCYSAVYVNIVRFAYVRYSAVTMSEPAPVSVSDKATIRGYRHGRVPRELREQQILDVAEEVFTEFGFHGASIEEVTRRAGIKRPLIYTYFGGKDQLYLACYRRARETLNERLSARADGEDRPVDQPPLQAAINRMARAYCEFLAEEPIRWDLLYGGGGAASGPIAEEVITLRFRTVEAIGAVIRRYVADHVDDQSILAFAHAASGAGEQLARWWRRTPEVSVEELADIIARFGWRGFSQLLDE